jgi:methionine synthase I (cobalamin-dependent)
MRQRLNLSEAERLARRKAQKNRSQQKSRQLQIALGPPREVRVLLTTEQKAENRKVSVAKWLAMRRAMAAALARGGPLPKHLEKWQKLRRAHKTLVQQLTRQNRRQATELEAAHATIASSKVSNDTIDRRVL